MTHFNQQNATEVIIARFWARSQRRSALYFLGTFLPTWYSSAGRRGPGIRPEAPDMRVRATVGQPAKLPADHSHWVSQVRSEELSYPLMESWEIANCYCFRRLHFRNGWLPSSAFNWSNTGTSFAQSKTRKRRRYRLDGVVAKSQLRPHRLGHQIPPCHLAAWQEIYLTYPSVLLGLKRIQGVNILK